MISKSDTFSDCPYQFFFLPDFDDLMKMFADIRLKRYKLRVVPKHPWLYEQAPEEHSPDTAITTSSAPKAVKKNEIEKDEAKSAFGTEIETIVLSSDEEKYEKPTVSVPAVHKNLKRKTDEENSFGNQEKKMKK